jgi:uncharacterized protein
MVVLFAPKTGEICTVQIILQPILFKSDSLPGAAYVSRSLTILKVMSIAKVRCPQCAKTVEYLVSNPNRPFCSERCKMIDLGAWASDQYAIPGKSEEADDSLQLTQDEIESGDPQHSQKAQ